MAKKSCCYGENCNCRQVRQPFTARWAGFGSARRKYNGICKAFNERNKKQGRDHHPRFDHNIFRQDLLLCKPRTPPATFLIKKAAKTGKRREQPEQRNSGSITASQVKEIAQLKMPDLNAKDMEGAMRIIEGSVRSMGLEVVEG